MLTENIQFVGVRQNNLKNLTLEFEHNKLIVITGLSGSGKSSLAFDTIYAEGGRRYIETFSPYTRQFLERLPRPDIDAAHGIRPALILRQHNQVTSSRSTVGTLTEVNEYLKVIWAYGATSSCSNCGKPFSRLTSQEISDKIIKKATTLNAQQILLAVASPITSTNFERKKDELIRQGFLRTINSITGEIKNLEDFSAAEIEILLAAETLLLIDRLKFNSSSISEELSARIFTSLTQALQMGEDSCKVIFRTEDSKPHSVYYTLKPHCASCNTDIPHPQSALFSFNNPIGACPECSGFGKVLSIDPALCIPDPNKTLSEGAIVCWSTPSTTWEFDALKKFCKRNDISLSTPWAKLSKAKRDLVFNGTDDSLYYMGVKGWFDYLHRKRHKLHVRVFLSRYRSESICPVCQGTRLKPEALLFSIDGRTLPEIWQFPVSKLESFLASLKPKFAGQHSAQTALLESLSRVQYLNRIGLGYITLDRQTRTLSGGECQRVNLTSILGSQLTNLMLILDEPTVGLHPADTQLLISTLRELRDRGNTVFVVEHDPEVILAADEVVDLGPLAGEHGGNIVFQGKPAELLKDSASLTAKHLKITPLAPKPIHPAVKLSQAPSLFIKQAHANNLQHLDVELPLHKLVVLSGPSGSGKSSLLKDCLYKSWLKVQQGLTIKALSSSVEAKIGDLQGLDQLDDIVFIDQTPLIKSPRSNAATYTKAWDIIRDVFAQTPQGKAQGLSKSAFSFNVEGGRCPQCKGAGYTKVEMQFLADVYVTCEHCKGLRFQDSVLSVHYEGKTISDFLNMTLEEAADFFSTHSEPEYAQQINAKLTALKELGLGYLRLGQPLSQLSGGEAQRVKLASYLGQETKSHCLFLFDEPTSGLHLEDVSKLLRAFHSLLKHGHSIFCIEHNVEVIQQADWIIDLGPGAGAKGGTLVAQGEPSDLLADNYACKASKTLAYIKDVYHSPRFAAAQVSKQKPKTSSTDIVITGARQHNLKNLNLTIPQNKLNVITGVSGSGKSSLAFDILFSEGQRRYIDCLSPYARHYLTQIKPAEVDRLQALPPTIAVSQKTAIAQRLSTIGTVSEVYQYLRLLFAKAGTQICPEHKKPVQSYTPEGIIEEIIAQTTGRVFVYAPVVTGRKGTFKELFERAQNAELTEAKIDGEFVHLDEQLSLKRHQRHWISLLVASLSQPSRSRSLLAEAVKQALALTGGTVEVAIGNKHAEPTTYSTERVCPECKRGFREPDPQDFSFQSAHGACSTCNGLGVIEGTKTSQICPDCGGSRLGEMGRSVLLGGLSIFDLAQMTPPKLRHWLVNLSFSPRLAPVVTPVVNELVSRLDIMKQIGLDYLDINRSSDSISGGEAQRLRLARALGSPLSGVCYVLDEPSIGLHTHDHELLIAILRKLRDQGNTVVVVEHDEDFIRAADHVIDLGPGGGSAGGSIVAQGSPKEVEASDTLTAQEMRRKPQRKKSADSEKTAINLELEGCSAHNLKEISVSIPHQNLTVVCGVSGSGKSSLVHSCLIPALKAKLEKENKSSSQKTWQSINNYKEIAGVIEIDQTPVGKTSSSCPASYLGVFSEIRNIFAELPSSKVQGLDASYFSFNTGKGRCERCEGKGFISVPMGFLPEAITECEDCHGKRYNRLLQDITFQGISIGDVLQLTISDAHSIFRNHRRIERTLAHADNLGIGYLVLGQPTYTLSGGEAQRLKIAKELGKTGKSNVLYVLNEPTVGLHMNDVRKLIRVLQDLVAHNNTVVVIEHNLDVIMEANHLIELGPGPGDKGGQVVYEGTIERLLASKKQTLTQDALRKFLA